MANRWISQRWTPTGAKEGQRLRTALGVVKRRLWELSEEGRAARLEIAELRRVVADQTKQIEVLTARVEFLMDREEELRAIVLGAHDQLMRRAEKIKADLATELLRSAPQHDASSQPRPSPEVPAAIPPVDKNVTPASAYADYEQLNKYLTYRRLVGRILEVANAVVPPETTVAVVSKGDEELLELGGGRQGWHFPQNEDGVYAGYYPADGAEAILHLEELREKGAEFLLFPSTAFWWLERYREFGEHLDSRYLRVWNDEMFIMYELREARSTVEERTP
jgi:hypothetical protein